MTLGCGGLLVAAGGFCRVGLCVPGKVDMVVNCATVLVTRNTFADGHTASNAPDLFRPPKLSGAGPG